MVSTSGFSTSSAARTAEAPAPCRISCLFSDFRTKKTSLSRRISCVRQSSTGGIVSTPSPTVWSPGFSGDPGPPVRVRCAVEREDRHPEVGGLARRQLTQPEELLPWHAKLLGHRVEVFPEEFRDEQLVPRGHGGVRGEDVGGEHLLPRLGEGNTLRRHLPPDALQHEERRVPLVPMVDGRRDPEGLHGPPAPPPRPAPPPYPPRSGATCRCCPARS